MSPSATLTNTPSLANSSLSFKVQDFSPHLSFSKQFIPVIVLAAVLLLFFLSNLLRYPRILYAPKRLGESCPPNNPRYSQSGVCFPGKSRVSRSLSFLPFPPSKSRDSKVTSEITTLESVPTVRLVRGDSSRSVEPRVCLADELTLPDSSPTLAGSSSSVSTPNTDTHAFPPKAYLSPPLPEIFDFGFLGPPKQEDVYTFQDGNCAASTPVHILDMVSEAQEAALSSSPPAPSFTGLYNFLNYSDSHTLPVEDMQISSTGLVSDAQNDTSHISPEPMSAPPVALAHPILVQRALFPWRRNSFPEALHRTITTVSNADPGQRHRPSVPSRLRYLITRSASVSRSSFHTHSTPESSLGRMSKKSSRTIKPSTEGQFDHRSFLPDLEPHAERDRLRPLSAIRILLGKTQTSPEPMHSMESDTQPQIAPTMPFDFLAENEQPSFFNLPAPPGTSEGPREAQKQFASSAEEEEPEGTNFSRDGRISPTETRRMSAALFLGLGVPVMSYPVSPPPFSRPVISGSNVVTGEPHIREPEAPERDGDRHDSESRAWAGLSQGASLRTVFTRWMGWGRDEPQGIVHEDDGSARTSADESVEVMIMNRWAGLDSV